MKQLYTFKGFSLLISILLVTGFISNRVKADTLHVSSNITPQEMVQEILIGGGVVTSNITYTGNNISRGEFWGGPGNIGIEEGILLTSGNVTVAPGPDNAEGAGANSGQGGDGDLTAIAGVSTFDACILEFDFIPQSTTVSFRYVFASEEYHEYVNQFNDAFGFFISGPGITGPFSNNSKNIALIPLTNLPVTINNVNCGNPYNCAENCMHCEFFVNNTQPFTQYDAFTKVLTAWANVVPCESYHIKLAIGDGLDHNFDSGVFLEANSFSSVGIASETEYTHPDHQVAIEGCNDLEIMFQLSVQPDADFYMPLAILGTATNGVDYEEITDSVFFPEGFSQAWLDIITIADGISEWDENIRLVYNSSLCDVDYDTVKITLKDYSLTLNMTPDTTINCNTEAQIGINSIYGFEPYTYVWSTGDTTPYITVSPLITTTYYVNVYALCDSSTMDSVIVYVNGPETNAGQDQTIPYGTPTTLQGSAGQGSGDYTYSWIPANLLDDPSSPTPHTILMEQNQQFTLTVTDLAGGCQDIDQMMVFVTGGPLNAGPVADPERICPGETAQLFSYASGGNEEFYTYSWTSDPPYFNSELKDPYVMPTETTTYYVTVNDGYNEVTRQVTVEVASQPVAEAGENDTIYHGTIGHLFGFASQGTGNYSWSWEPADKLQNPTFYNPTTFKLTETTIFYLTVTDLTTGCVNAEDDWAKVVVNGGPLLTTADVTDPLICGGGSTQLHALPTGGYPLYTYSWKSDPQGFNSIESDPVISPSVTTTYYLTVDDGFNTTQAQTTVVVSQSPAVSLGGDILACPLDTVHLTANIPNMTYYWSNGSQEQSITVGTTGIGFDMKTIWLEVENEDGCKGIDSVRVIFDFAQCNTIEEKSDEVYLYIYPNPTPGKIFYEWLGLTGNVELQVTDMHGNEILEQTILSPLSGEYKGFFNLGGHPEGIYLLRLISDNNVFVRKILLQ
jgi:hypothetical protein